MVECLNWNHKHTKKVPDMFLWNSNRINHPLALQTDISPPPNLSPQPMEPHPPPPCRQNRMIPEEIPKRLPASTFMQFGPERRQHDDDEELGCFDVPPGHLVDSYGRKDTLISPTESLCSLWWDFMSLFVQQGLSGKGRRRDVDVSSSSSSSSFFDDSGEKHSPRV